MSIALTIVAIAVALPGIGTAAHLALLSAASLTYRQPSATSRVPMVKFLVVVPAHNEEAVIDATLRAIMADRRPWDRVLVVADRCTDRTPSIARERGALVLERGLDEEPGRAAAREAALQWARNEDWDAIVMIDADSVIESGFLDACERALASGAPALQARSEAAIGERLVDQVSLAAFALQGVTMPRGRDRLGLLVRLRGTGMVLRREVVERFAFRGAASEDLWFSLDMCLAGLRPRHVEAARLRSLNVSSWRDGREQRVRYEAGRMSAAREFVGPLLRRHDKASLEAAWFLCTPPFAVGALSLVAGLALAAAAGAMPLAATLGALLAVLVVSLVIALLQASATWRTWAALAIAPWYLPWKAVVQVRALLRMRQRDVVFGATPRR